MSDGFKIIDHSGECGEHAEQIAGALRDMGVGAAAVNPPLVWRNEPPSEEEFEQGLWLLRKHVGEKPEILPSWQYGLSLKVNCRLARFAGPIIIHEQETGE